MTLKEVQYNYTVHTCTVHVFTIITYMYMYIVHVYSTLSTYSIQLYNYYYNVIQYNIQLTIIICV